MSEFQLSSLTMPAADFGPVNPLPDLRNKIDAPPPFEDAVPDEDRRYVGHGWVANILPYRALDQYSQDLQPRAFRTVVLENEHLRATFLLELGGRLWSLVDKRNGEELLYVNPVFRPRNLAIRNAWFSGGVEWNMGLFGHTPFTCEPLFAARLTADDGTPVLRLYEWERIRQVAYQLDIWLPDDSPVLLVRVRIINPHDHAVPMYWWSNIAVPEEPGRRTLVPVERMYRYTPGRGMYLAPAPDFDGIDISRAAILEDCAEFFFHLSEGQRPWVASLDAQGRGLVQTSTPRLRGRKLFVWGTGVGGRNWQEFLSVPGQAYLEIQAGLARTQLECLPMPAGAEWSWLEAYGPLAADANAAQDADWTRARQEVAGRLETLLPAAKLDALYRESAALANRPPEEILQRGSGWAALEERRRRIAGEASGVPDALVFDDASLTEEQAPWLALLETGEFPDGDPLQDPGAWQVQPAWHALLEAAVQAGRGVHWRSLLHLSVRRCWAGSKPSRRPATWIG